jgi:hypothetical protein
VHRSPHQPGALGVVELKGTITSGTTAGMSVLGFRSRAQTERGFKKAATASSTNVQFPFSEQSHPA